MGPKFPRGGMFFCSKLSTNIWLLWSRFEEPSEKTTSWFAAVLLLCKEES